MHEKDSCVVDYGTIFPMLSDSLKALDAKERKRIQNREAQRTYRRNQKERVRALEKAVDQRLKRPVPAEISNSERTTTSDLSFCDDIWNIPMEDQMPPLSFPQTDTMDQTPVPALWSENSPEQKTQSSSQGRTALHRAIVTGNESVCRLLLDRGADTKKQDSNGLPALHLAVESGSESVTMLLLKDGDPNVQDFMGRTALFHAVRLKDENMTKMLLEAQINVNSKDMLGEVALHSAVENGSESIILLLLKYGADVDA